MLNSNTCPVCGQVVVMGSLPPLPPIKAKLFDIISRRPGVDAETLRNLVWADDANGGPDTRACLHVHICQANKLLAACGLAIRGSKSFGYRVTKI